MWHYVLRVEHSASLPVWVCLDHVWLTVVWLLKQTSPQLSSHFDSNAALTMIGQQTSVTSSFPIWVRPLWTRKARTKRKISRGWLRKYVFKAFNQILKINFFPLSSRVLILSVSSLCSLEVQEICQSEAVPFRKSCPCWHYSFTRLC